MAYFTQEQINKAKEIDLLTYLQTVDPNELKHDSRGTYHTVSHDSLKISNGMWYWFSRGIGGKSALDYLIHVKEMSFTDAISHLINERGLEKKSYVLPKRELTEQEKIAKLKLPQKSDNCKIITNYLLSRGIDKDIINECINNNLIYQDYPNNNVVFVGYDEKGNARYGGVRGSNKTRYMQDCYGSDKAYSFRLLAKEKNNSVHLFESGIDLLSYATLLKKNNYKWYNENLISLAGVYNTSNDLSTSKVPKTLLTFLKNNKDINTIYLHFDNDLAGRNCSKVVINSLSESYNVIDKPPKCGKDFNDYLRFLLNRNLYKPKCK